jgi:hypothetical protein
MDALVDTSIRQPTLPLRLKVVYPALMGLYLIALAIGHALRPEHFVVLGLMALCYAGPRAQRFIDLFFPVALAGMLYDLQRFWEGSLQLPVQVAGPYRLERALFGFTSNGARVTPNEFFLVHHAAWVDVAAALPYLTYIFESIGMSVYLFFKDPARCRRFGWVFLGVNVAGMATEALFPVAPPWYVQEYGLGSVVRGLPSSPAAATRFDALTGTHIFSSFYARGTDVFGAIPSLHVALAALVVCYAVELGKPWMSIFSTTFLLLMMFAAVYLQHHYVIDLVVALAYVGTAYGIDRWLHRTVARESPG